MRLVEVKRGTSINPDMVVSVERNKEVGTATIWTNDQVSIETDYDYKTTCKLLEGKK